MKRQGFNFWVVLGLACWLCMLAACTVQTPAPQLPTAAPSLTATAVPSRTPTPLPSATPTATPTAAPTACAERQGTLWAESLPSALLKAELPYAVYLPPCYPAGAPAGGYPVLYLLHGQDMDQNVWVELGLPETADRLIASGEMQPMLIVMPFEQRALQSPQESKYAAALLDELLPRVEQDYAACTLRACRMLGGISRGGSWAVHIGLQHPELFGALGGHSLAVFYGDTRDAPRWVKAIPADEVPRLWLDMGEKDRFRKSYTEFVKVLKDSGLAFSEHTYPGGHDASYWSAHLEDYLRWYGGN